MIPPQAPCSRQTPAARCVHDTLTALLADNQIQAEIKSLLCDDIVLGVADRVRNAGLPVRLLQARVGWPAGGPMAKFAPTEAFVLETEGHWFVLRAGMGDRPPVFHRFETVYELSHHLRANAKVVYKTLLRLPVAKFTNPSKTVPLVEAAFAPAWAAYRQTVLGEVLAPGRLSAKPRL